MKRSDLRLLVGTVLAVAVPAAVLDLGNDDFRRAAELSAAPFAWRGILLAHLAAALPLALLIAGWIRSSKTLASSAPWPWMVLGATVAGIGTALLPEFGDAIDQAHLGALPRLLLRSALAFLLVLPWCVAALDRSVGIPRRWPLRIAVVVAIGLAVVPCAMYTETALADRTQEAARLLANERLVKAEGIVTGLCELGSNRPIGTAAPIKMRKRLAATVAELRWQVDQPFFSAADMPADRVSRAVVFVRLERLDDAAALLRPIVPDNDTASLMLAAVYQNQERWAESDALFAATLKKMLPLASTQEAARAACRTALDGLADNARFDDRPADVEAFLNRGLQQLPEDAAHYHFLLGRHYHENGRFSLALDHLRTAAQLDVPNLSQPTDDLIRRIRTSTPGCFDAGS
ncbi:MAG: tetratricopeptide repeat protein [Gemmataceae bacterium]